MIKTPKRHCGAVSCNYIPNFINVSEIVFELWPYNQSGTPALRTDNFSKSDNNTLRQILAEGKNRSSVTFTYDQTAWFIPLGCEQQSVSFPALLIKKRGGTEKLEQSTAESKVTV